jgi:hypothetical protein
LTYGALGAVTAPTTHVREPGSTLSSVAMTASPMKAIPPPQIIRRGDCFMVARMRNECGRGALAFAAPFPILPESGAAQHASGGLALWFRRK